MQQPHRPGPLHQTNKAHKGARHSRKSSAASEIKNKVISKSNSRQVFRDARLNAANLGRKAKWERTISDKRSIGGDSHAPLVIGVVGSAENFLKGLNAVEDDECLTIRQLSSRMIYVIAKRLKLRFKLVLLDQENFDETLELVKTLDIIMLLHQIEDIAQGNDITALDLLQIVYIHCMPTLVHVIDGYNKNGTSMIKVKRLLKAKVGEEKMSATETSQDYMQLFHILGSCKRQKSLFKSARSVVSSDKAEVIDGCLAISGFVRNKTLDPNCLIHMPGFDDYQIAKIELMPDTIAIKPRTDHTDKIILPDPMKQETLEQENELDPMEGEQTWPTAEELGAEIERKNLKKVRKMLPPGTSGYQGAWIPESDEEDDGSDQTDSENDDDDEDENDAAMRPVEELDSENEMDQSEMDDAETVGGGGDDNASMMDVDEYDKKNHNEKEMNVLEKLRQARMEEMFPDEVDTPIDVPARVRFARYRGLKSFRTSTWDPQENLPPDYSRIYQFQNFQHTKRRALAEESLDGAQPGQYVRVHLANVPKDAISKILSRPVLPSLVALLKYERKMTVMNLLIKRLPGSNLKNPIKSKDELLFYVGHRRFKARPIFTSHSVSTKHKYERFLRDDVAMVATVYAPVTFPPAPALVFRMKPNGEKELVASGSVLDSNPNRLIIKRVRLSAHPYKIHSKTAVLRFMFFNSEDVLYFKPVELVTKYNRRGHITEPLGTHGHMKCTFDKKIRSDDCVFMNLYKRVFPKWSYDPVCG